MAKKAKRIEPDQDGILDTGIVRRWIPPRRSKYDPPQKVPDEFRSIPVEQVVEEAVQFLKRFTDGPHELGPHFRGPGFCIYHADFDNGERLYKLPPDAPPKCNDYIELLNAWWQYRNAIKRVDNFSRSVADLKLLAIGQLLERIRHVRDAEPLVLSEKGRRNRPKGTGATLTTEQESVVFEAIGKLIPSMGSQNKAAEAVASQLRTGAFTDLPGIGIVDIEGKTLANKYSARNKPSLASRLLGAG